MGDFEDGSRIDHQAWELLHEDRFCVGGNPENAHEAVKTGEGSGLEKLQMNTCQPDKKLLVCRNSPDAQDEGLAES